MGKIFVLRITLVFFLVMLVSPVHLMAKTHFVPFNMRTTLNLSDGDEIVLSDIPVDWGYNRVSIGVNSSPYAALSGVLIVNNCRFRLKDYYKEIKFYLTDSVKISYSGPDAALPVQWWLDYGFVPPECEDLDSIAGVQERSSFLETTVRAIFKERLKNYSDIGPTNTSYIFKGVSGLFNVSSMPLWAFNIIKVKIEPVDGKKLDGYIYIGEKRVELGGYNSIVSIAPRYRDLFFFEIVFSSYRKVKITWWAEHASPSQKTVDAKAKEKGDSVSVVYEFEGTPYTWRPLKISFNKNDFTDGNYPVVSKYAYYPNGPTDTIGFSMHGALYDISANVRPGKHITMALPLDMAYDPETDTLWFERFSEKENSWERVPIDSIVNGYAYFSVDHFCFGWLKKILKTVAKYVVKKTSGLLTYVPGANKYVDKLANYIGDFDVAVIDGVTKTYEWLREIVSDVYCFDWEEAGEEISDKFVDGYWYFLETFVLKGDDPSLPQGTLADAVRNDEKLVKRLESIRGEDLISLYDQTLFFNVDGIDDCSNLAPDYVSSCKQWKVTKYNLDILLADFVLKNLGIRTPRFRFIYSSSSSMAFIVDEWRQIKVPTNVNLYIKNKDEILGDAAWLVNGLQTCFDIEEGLFPNLTNISRTLDKLTDLDFQGACKQVFDFYSLESLNSQLSTIGNVWDCGNLFYYKSKAKNMLQGHDKRLIAISEAMSRVSLLAWIDKNNFRPYSRGAFANIYEGTRTWLRLVAPLMQRNNIISKTLASLALYEFIHYGSGDNLAELNRALDIHYGTNGGYSEGTGYSGYIWDEVTYILSALKDAYEYKRLDMPVSERFMKSADYMASISSPVCSVVNKDSDTPKCNSVENLPVEIDDGLVYEPDYRPWAKLTGDSRYMALSDVYGMDSNKINPLVPFGIPDLQYNGKKSPLPIPARKNPYVWNYFEDGIGLISITNPTTKETVSLSMIAESGNLRKLGQSHDQQDNLSITLTSSINGNIIHDRGYSGFSRRQSEKFHKFIYHNVLAPVKSDMGYSEGNNVVENIADIAAQGDNRVLAYNDLLERYTFFSGDNPGFVYKLLLFWAGESNALDNYSGSNKYTFRLEGGSDAELEDTCVVIPDTLAFKKGDGAIAYTASLFYGQRLNPLGRDNRTILYFGGSLWVIDRPNKNGMVWLMNSPIGEIYEDSLVNVFGSYNKIVNENKIYLYGLSSESVLGLENFVVREFSRIPQNGRSDLENYTYGFHDEDAMTYVMQHPVIGDEFVKFSESCPANCQCFRKVFNGRTYLLVVPSKNQSFEICEILGDECSFGKKQTDAVLFATLTDEGWDWNTVDGDVYETHEYFEAGVGMGIRGGTTNRSGYAFRMKSGDAVEGKYKSPYLSAIPLLLLR